jgi:shikimate dehydrogenase
MADPLHITGKTRLYAIIGDPIAQVRSPEVFTARFATAGIDAVLIPAHVPADRFDAIVPALLALGNLDGVLVTVPFKARMVPLATRLGETSQIVGAINALRRESDDSWTADMFDGKGFVNGARQKGVRLEGRSVLLFGAGGAGSAVACALAEAGVRAIYIVDPLQDRSASLIARLQRAFPECSFETRNRDTTFDMVVNASPVGMSPQDGLPGEVGALRAATIVGDVVITDHPTALIRHGEAHGCICITGRDMHSGQLDALMAFFGSGRHPGGADGDPARVTDEAG